MTSSPAPGSSRVQLPDGWARLAFQAGPTVVAVDDWEPLPAPVAARAVVVSGDLEIAILEITLLEKSGSDLLGRLRGVDVSGCMTLEMAIDVSGKSGSLRVGFSMDEPLAPRQLIPTLEWLAQLTPGRAIRVLLSMPPTAGGIDAHLATTRPMPGGQTLLAPGLVDTVRLIDRLGELTHQPVPVPLYLSAEDGSDLAQAVKLLDGETGQRVGFRSRPSSTRHPATRS